MKLLPLVTALSLSLASMAALAQAAAPAAAASAPAFTVRPEVGQALNQAVELFKANKPAEAKARIEAAQAATANATPAEATVMHRIRGLLQMQMEQWADAVKSLEAAVALNAQLPADTLQCLENLSRAHFNLKAYPAVVAAVQKAQAAGSKSPQQQAMLVRATYLQNDYAGTVKLLEAQDKQAALSMDELRILASSYGQSKDDLNYVRVTERLLSQHGREEYWPDLLSRVQRVGAWQPRWDVDLYRLRLKLDQMDEANDYLVLAEMLAKAGLPADAQKVLEAGYAKGMLGKGGNVAEQTKFRAAVTKQANDDRASLASAADRPPVVTDARSAANTFNTGAALVSVGQFDKGLALMKAALAGPLADATQGRVQYGQALLQAGKAAEAVEQFKQAGAGNDPLALLARLWAAVAAPKKP